MSMLPVTIHVGKMLFPCQNAIDVSVGQMPTIHRSLQVWKLGDKAGDKWSEVKQIFVGSYVCNMRSPRYPRFEETEVALGSSCGVARVHCKRVMID